MSNLYPAPAKVNLHLAVTGITEEGYHTLDTSFVYVDIGDTLEITLSDVLQVRCSDEALSGEKNLVYQVLSAFQRKHDVSLGLDVFIDKQLPAMAGLGGGSSDAATALWVANQLWSVGCSTEALIYFSVRFGADIPCFLYGKASQAYGVGEKLSAYQGVVPQQNIVLAWPGEGVSTVAAFAQFDQNEIHALTDEKAAATVRARSGAVNFDLGYNDLEKSAVVLCSPLLAMLTAMKEKSERAWMSGSGSACVAVCDSSEQAYALAKYLQKHKLATWVHTGIFLPEHPLLASKIGA
ncbi:MAG: 4-(cytidine 5'-diphospho)-2-C-methyl-D-erythritol kinase [Ghiorsea sp.]|nr:4-(cytidine 5'-diphospho)-2-C-methyl-D-erythritol kinase [Ghiorsea sp.]